MIKNRLRECREKRKMSQEELAKKSGLSRATLSKIENQEEAVVTTATIASLSEALKMKPSDIFLM